MTTELHRRGLKIIRPHITPQNDWHAQKYTWVERYGYLMGLGLDADFLITHQDDTRLDNSVKSASFGLLKLTMFCRDINKPVKTQWNISFAVTAVDGHFPFSSGNCFKTTSIHQHHSFNGWCPLYILIKYLACLFTLSDSTPNSDSFSLIISKGFSTHSFPTMSPSNGTRWDRKLNRESESGNVNTPLQRT